MEVLLRIDDKICIRCAKCVRVCPSAIFTQEVPAGEIGLRNVYACIVCGHCAAVCPTGAVVHGNFPPDRIHRVDAALLPSPEQFSMLVKKRRSNRAFTSKPVPREYLERIVDAAHRAPTASNRQEVSFTIVTDPAKLKLITDSTMEVIASLVKMVRNPLLKPFIKMFAPDAYKSLRRMERLVKEHAKGNDPILRKAAAAILIHVPPGNRFGRDDANLAYQNASLMAEALGVAHFYTGYVCEMARHDGRKRRLARRLGIGGAIHAGMALGMPALDYPNYMDKKDVEAEYI